MSSRALPFVIIVIALISACKPAKPLAGTVRVSDLDGMQQVFVPAGAFEMGSSASDKAADEDEKPQHMVSLDSFWMDRTEITNALYAGCVAAGACTAPAHSSRYGDPKYTNHPILGSAWTQAQSYCTWAARRLPTEAEWEKAARGTDGRIYPWGNTPPENNFLNFDQQVDDTSPVGVYPQGASPYGALDMAGNVWEWVADWYDPIYYSHSPASNPSGGIESNLRVLRGGDRDSISKNVRVTERFWAFPGRNDTDGFRCAQSN